MSRVARRRDVSSHARSCASEPAEARTASSGVQSRAQPSRPTSRWRCRTLVASSASGMPRCEQRATRADASRCERRAEVVVSHAAQRCRNHGRRRRARAVVEPAARRRRRRGVVERVSCFRRPARRRGRCRLLRQPMRSGRRDLGFDDADRRRRQLASPYSTGPTVRGQLADHRWSSSERSERSDETRRRKMRRLSDHRRVRGFETLASLAPQPRVGRDHRIEAIGARLGWRACLKPLGPPRTSLRSTGSRSVVTRSVTWPISLGSSSTTRSSTTWPRSSR